MKRLLRAILPSGAYSSVRQSYHYLSSSRARRRARWTVEWTDFLHSQRDYFFKSAAHYLHVNRNEDIAAGYYFEFGCHSASTMRMCWKRTEHLFDFQYVAFDSFEGLPEIEEVDKQPIWFKGSLKTAEEDFVRVVTAEGMPRKRLTTVKGFYDASLTPQLQQQFLPRKASIIYIDCDLYASTVPVLSFIKPFLQVGCIVAFDDWNCFWADPNRGERLAWREFLEANPELHFEPFVSTHMLQSFIYTGTKG